MTLIESRSAGNPGEVDRAVEHLARLDATFEDVGQKLLDVGAHGRRSATHGDVGIERCLAGGHRLVLRHTDAADRATGPRDADRRGGRLLEAYALEYRVGAEPAGELAHALDCVLAALADDIGRAELARQGDPVLVAAEDDDLLGAQALGGDHTTKPDRTIADDCDALSGADAGDDSGVVAGAHDVGERQQRWHERVVLTNRQHEQRAICIWDPQRLGLRAVLAVVAEEAAVHALGVQPLVTEGARAVGERKRHHDDVAWLHGAHLGADFLDDSDCLVTHGLPGLAALHRLIRPKVAAADAGSGDANDGVGRRVDGWVRNVLDTDVARLVHQRCSHSQKASCR